MTEYIWQLINYGLKKELIKESDINYIYNQLIHFFKLEHEEIISSLKEIKYPDEAIFPLVDNLYRKGIIDDNTIQTKDLISSKAMNIFADKPSVVINHFNELSKVKYDLATDWFYKYMQDLGYIKVDRILKNKSYDVDSDFGKIEITINLSKPEKDPLMIAKAKSLPATNYPKCVLCPENEGFAGNLQRDSRDTIRLLPLTINDEKWFMQYSPYIYYNEHAIVLSNEHRPMQINLTTFKNLLELVDKVEGYFFGSNADLPIVGGSILSHDHYQGGKYQFPIENAQVIRSYKHKNMDVEILNWPLSTIRIRGRSRNSISKLSNTILNEWINYNNPKLNIFNYTGETRHNTVTPIARKKGNLYEIDLVLRNNFTNEEFPLGLYHPHEDVWPIKKENIGLIEVMGLAILPGRLISELRQLADAIESNKEIPVGFEDFYEDIKKDYHNQNSLDYVYQNAGERFVKGLTNCGVFYERDSAFFKFVKGVLENDSKN